MKDAFFRGGSFAGAEMRWADCGGEESAVRKGGKRDEAEGKERRWWDKLEEYSGAVKHERREGSYSNIVAPELGIWYPWR